MPRYSAQVDIKYSTNAKGASKEVTKANKAMEKSTKSTSKAMAAMGRVAGRALTAGLAAASAAMAYGIAKGSEFQAALADLSAITGATGTDLEFLGSEALRMSSAYGIAGTDVATATKIIASAKAELLDQPEALAAITEQAIILSKAQRVDLTTSTRVLTQAMNQFGLGADEAARATNTIAAAAKFGTSELGDAGAALVQAGTAARLANVDFEQTNAAIQVLAKRGVVGARAGTALRAIFTRMASRLEDELNPQVIGLTKTLERLAPIQNDVVRLGELFGEEYTSAGKILIENRGLFASLTEQITGTNIANEQAATNMGTFRESANRLYQVLQNKLIKTFLDMEPTLTAATEQLIRLFETGRETGFLAEVVEGAKIFGEGLTGLIAIIGKAVESLKPLWDIMRKIQSVAADVLAMVMILNTDTGGPTAETLEDRRQRMQQRIRERSKADEAASINTRPMSLDMRVRLDGSGQMQVEEVNASTDLSLTIEQGLMIPGGAFGLA